MKHRIKKENGVTMLALVITVVILVILTNVLIYNAQDNIYIKSLTNLYNDIDMLREKVSAYYNEYGKIPAEIKYTNISQLSDILGVNDKKDNFYIIDLEAMQGITLNYGKDYEKVKNDKENANNYTDVYIINENSHNIFYVEGIKVKENDTTKTYYTDYIEPDQTEIDLRYIDGILIPEGYYYIGTYTDNSGNKSIVISTNKDEQIDDTSETQFIWQKQISTLSDVPDSIKLTDGQREDEFLKSVNTYKGYFRNKNKTTDVDVVYLPIDETKWSEAYTKETEYEDINGDKVTIPQGFRVSMSTTMNTVENGFVVKDSNDNEWVWVVIPDSVFATATSNTDYDNIEADLIEYASDYREGSEGQSLNWTDEYYDGCGVVATDTKTAEEVYTEMYNKMLSSVYTNGGFWISRYEIGDSTATANNTTRTSSSETTGVAVSQANQIPYNYVTCSEAQTLASGMSTDSSKTSSLLFGIQWDLVCKFLEENSNLTKTDIKSDSTSWGNYNNATVTNIKTGAKQLISSVWTETTDDKQASSEILLTTGASEYTSKVNIYNFAGNEYEWTLEHATSDSSKPCADRGGTYHFLGSSDPASSRYSDTTSLSSYGVGFRATLY